jgi:hypothetical protein
VIAEWPTWRVAAEVEIRSLVQRYNALGDSGRVEQFVDLFTEDAVYVVTGSEEPYVGHDGLRRLVVDASGDLRDWSGAEAFHLRHFTSTHQIDFDDERHATGRVYYQCVMRHGLDHWGRYVDRYRRAPGSGWQFEARTEARDGMVEGGWCWALWGPGGSRRHDPLA